MSKFNDIKEVISAIKEGRLELPLTIDEILKWNSIFTLQGLESSDRRFIAEYGDLLGISKSKFDRTKKLFRDAQINVKNLGENNGQ